MNDRATDRLLDAVEACAAVNTFLGTRSLEEYQTDYGLRLQIERLLEIIGEALNQAQSDDRSIAAGITDFRLIVDMRNRLIHGYHGVDDRIVWRTASSRVPTLRVELEHLLAARESTAPDQSAPDPHHRQP